MMSPYKIPARITFIQLLTSKDEQLSGLNTELAVKTDKLRQHNAELAAKTEKLSKQCALNRPMAFMHVPKTSGVALTYRVLAALPLTNCLDCYDREFFGALRSCKTVLPPSHHEVYDALPPGDGIDFVAGHIMYSALIQGRPTAHLMTVLREPRSRIPSLWTFYRSQSDGFGLPLSTPETKSPALQRG
jgi:hypothetical protein